MPTSPERDRYSANDQGDDRRPDLAAPTAGLVLAAVALAVGAGLAGVATASPGGPGADAPVDASLAGENRTNATPSLVLSLAEGAAGPNLSVLTADGLKDARPSLAPTGEGYVAVWQRQMGSKSRKAGQDIFYATYRDGEWSQPRPVVDNYLDDFVPRVAYDSRTGRAVAVWTQVTKDFRGQKVQAGEVIKEMEIVYATFDGDSWSAPTRVTSNEAADAAPRIAANDGRFLVAWSGDGDGDVNTSDGVVRHVVIEGGAYGSTGELDFARPPRTVDPGSGDGFRIGFFLPEESGAETGEIVVLQGSQQFEEMARYDVEGFRGLGVHGDAVAWATGSEGQSTIYYAEGGAERQVVPTSIDTQSVQDLALHSARGSPLLTYRGAPRNASGRRLLYLLRHEGEWVYEHGLDESADGELVFAQTTVATRSDSFGAVFAGHLRSKPTQNSDLFALVHQFRPDLRVRANLTSDPRNVSTGDSVTVPYSVANLGEQGLEDRFTVTLSAGSEVLATTTHEGLGVGENVSGSLSATVPDSGQVTLSVDRENDFPEVSESNNRVRLQFGSRDAAVTEYRPVRDGSQIAVVATVENAGSVSLDTVDVVLSSPNGTIDRTTIGPLGPGETRTVELKTTMDVANSTPTARVSARVPGDANSANDGLGVQFLQPEVGLFERSINITNVEGRLVAQVLVVNDGSKRTRFTLSARGPDGTTLQTVNGTIPASTSPDEIATRRISVELPASVSGKRVTFVAAVPGDRDNTDNAVRVQVPSLPGLDTRAPRIRSVTANATDAGLAVRVTASEQLDLDSLRVSVSGPKSVTLTGEDFEAVGTGFSYRATVPAEATGTYTVTVEAAADAAGNAAQAGQTASASLRASGGGFPVVPLLAVVVLAVAAVAFVRYRG